ncbi:MAG TPA: hypothetical protein VK629_15115 [Steroidobacteraceae bacterium]|nr:hypothetical protein [Steroidobacteraceae bacterium]
MNKVTAKVLNPTHYSVSTAAAVVYALVWLLGTRTEAEVPQAPMQTAAVLEAVVVTAKQDIMLDAVIVTAKAERVAATLAPVIVAAKLEPGSRNSSNTSASGSVQASTGHATPRQGLAVNVGRWLRGVLLM